ncbi:hypothetical protein AB1Y20_004015 [Prymnesium parvum]|uniref:TsaA-like domain-containing protein n=1 Tax=Prymnesium parvum TaxID=97485 RepID=A0AB34J6C3_PRYPA
MRQQLKPTPSGELTKLSYTAIGTISSCFVERRGTPRQGMLAPAARAWLQLDVRVVQPAALEGLEQFSHVWLLYDFHENTNAAKLSSSAGGSAGQLRAKVHPPGLGGERIGLFATRTPHRPSPIGLTVAQLLEVRGDTLILGGADIVDGTPVLDIKPYLRHDIQADAKVPQWCERKTDASSVVSVGFTPEAEMALEAAVPHLRFFSDLTNAREAVVQMLQLDIRSVHQGRGKQTTSKEGQEYYCRIDVLELTFSTFDSQVLVTRICVKR